MKKELNPTMIIVAVVAVVAVLGGLYYMVLGPGSGPGKSKVASPYGLPTSAEDFKKPLPTGSGRNTITGEALPPRTLHPDPVNLLQTPHTR